MNPAVPEAPELRKSPVLLPDLTVFPIPLITHTLYCILNQNVEPRKPHNKPAGISSLRISTSRNRLSHTPNQRHPGAQAQALDVGPGSKGTSLTCP